MFNHISVAGLKNHYKKFKPSGTWFNATEMQFFNTEIHNICEVYNGEKFLGCLFITSEIFNGSSKSEKKWQSFVASIKLLCRLFSSLKR